MHTRDALYHWAYLPLYSSKNTFRHLPMTVTSKSFLLCFLFSELLQSFRKCGHLSKGISQTRFTGSVPKNARLHLLLYQSIHFFTRQIIGCKVPLLISLSCVYVCGQAFLAVFSRNSLSFLNHSEVKARNSICGGRKKGLCSKPKGHGQQKYRL